MKQLGHIFLIDDDPVQLEVATRLLGKLVQTTRVERFSEPDIALEILQSRKTAADELPDIILLDLNMPVMSGWEFLERFAQYRLQITKPISVYILSSSQDPSDLDRAREFPFLKGYLSKPLTRDALIQLGI